MVRQRTLTPSFQGSNPCGPAKENFDRSSLFFLCNNVNKNFLRIINLIEELGSEKKTPITIQQYQDIINKSSNLWMSNGVDEAFRFIRSYFNFID